MAKYSQQQIEELMESIVSTVKDLTSVATSTNELTSVAIDAEEDLESAGVPCVRSNSIVFLYN